MRLIRGRGGSAKAGTVVVVPGPDGARQGPVEPCVACKTTGSGIRVPLVIDGDRGEGDRTVVVVCLDGHECATRYRRGVDPETFAAAELRGDLLGAVPL